MEPEAENGGRAARRALVAVGLTGGIAAGKSTVAAMFAARGAMLIDADVIARAVVEPGEPALEAIRRRFGVEVMGPDGRLDRAALAARVFADEHDRQALNAITHPTIVREIKRRLARERDLATQAVQSGASRRIVVAEIPLLIEEDLVSLVDQVVLVVAKQATQAARLIEGKGLTESQAWARVRAQLPLEQKLPFAHWVIDGESSLADTERRVGVIWRALSGFSHRRTCARPEACGEHSSPQVTG